jgi:DNA/RNA-binding domain of Phe-tRNA-synthetase-like protein
VKWARFERLGAFAYSEEDGTWSATHYEDDVPEDVKQRRLDKLMRVQQNISAEIEAAKVGTVMPVIIDRVEGDFTLRFTDGTERFVPIGQTEPVPVAPHEYSYCDDANEVLCRLEIRQVEKTKVDEDATNVCYIVQGNKATTDSLLLETAQRIVDLTVKYCGGRGEVIVPTVKE